jgi:hypothetical protein
VDPLDMELNGRHLLADRRHVVDQKSADKEVRARLWSYCASMCSLVLKLCWSCFRSCSDVSSS